MQNLEEVAAGWQDRDEWQNEVRQMPLDAYRAVQHVIADMGPDGFDASAEVGRIAAELGQTEAVVTYAFEVALTDPIGRRYFVEDGRVRRQEP